MSGLGEAKKFKLRDIHELISANDYNSAERILKEINYEALRFQERRGFNTLLCRILIKQKRKRELDELFESFEMMSRDWIDYIIFIQSFDSKSAEIIFTRIINEIDLKPKDIDKLISSKCCNIIRHLNGKFIKTNFDGNDLDIEPTIFNERSIQNQLKCFNMINKSFINNIKSYNLVIDGGNVLFACQQDYNNLKSIFNQLSVYYNPIIVLHERHNKKVKKIFKNLSNVVFTPRNQNDDFYILYLSLLNQSPIISRDKYGDHIQKFGIDLPNNNFLKNFLDEKLITYNTSPFEFKKPKITQVRKHDSGIYIPSVNGGMFNLIYS